MNLFDILGPVMVGPSSSHTAGAVRIGYMARRLLKDKPVHAEIYLHGSFATTGVGHGTDKAIVAGLLGMQPDDIRIPESFDVAKREGLSFAFHIVNLNDVHPNTALIIVDGAGGKHLEVEAASIGGGRIMIHKLDGVEANFTAENPTIIIHNQDTPGHVAKVTNMLAVEDINIATMHLYRGDKRDGYAVMVIETDQPVPEQAVKDLETLSGILKVIYVNKNE